MATKKKMLQAAAGQAGGAGGAVLNVEDVFSTYLYEGNGGSQIIQNGINLGQSFGSGSVKFSDGSSDWIVSQSSSEFAFGTGDFTLECWVYRTSDTGSTNNLIDLRESDNTENKPSLAIDSSDKVAYYSNGSWRTVGTTSVPIGQWVHLAVVRSSGTTKVYYNGTAEGTAFSDSYNYSASTVANIGGAWSGDFDLDGYIAEARISDTARYTANFTTPTAPFSSDANTVLLTCKGADPFVDNSPNAFTITQNGNPQATTFGPFDAAEAGEGGMVWFKAREIGNYPPVIFDTNRGVTKYLRTSEAFGEQTNSGITAFNSDGFDIAGSFTTGAATPYASWTFRKAPKFFTCLTYTGDGTNGREIAHDLGGTVGSIFVKKTNVSREWAVYHRGVGATHYGALNSTDQFYDQVTLWNDTEPTSTHFTVGYNNSVNTNGDTYVAYLFAHNDGDGEFGPDGDADIIKCGSYTTDGSNNATVELGFEPQWVLIKRTDSTGSWNLFDSMRGMGLSGVKRLEPENSGAESDLGTSGIQAYATGFNHVSTYAPNANMIYIAIRRGTKVPESGTEVFGMDDYGTGGDGPVTGFVTDFSLLRYRNQNDNWHAVTRLCGKSYLKVQETTAETNNGNAVSDRMDGMWNTAVPNYFLWGWKRAPGYFDAVAYSGNNTQGRNVPHNLGVAPEMIWVKARDFTRGWNVYHKDLTASGGQEPFMELNAADAVNHDSSRYPSAPTATDFVLGSNDEVNSGNYNYIAYLFSSLDGISKVGSFSHATGTPTNVDCGFANGARFVLWKKYSNTDGWQVYDTTRGIVAGNDPFLQLNSTAAEINEDLIDPLSSGFTVSANKNSGDYIFYAIA